jgi:hypothetical protein
MKAPEVMPAQPPKTPTKPGFRPKLRFRKSADGSIHLFNSIIKPNQVISCYPEDIPEQYKSVLVCIDSVEMQEWAKKENDLAVERENLYGIVERDGKGWYDVVNKETEKTLNEKRLRKADAEKLCDSLNS